MTWDNKNTELGIDENISGVLCYVLGWVSGIILLFIEKNSFVKFHAWQSIMVFGVITAVQIIIKVLASIFGLMSIFLIGGIAMVFVSILTFISILIWIGTFVLWIILMVKAYQGEKFMLPIAGEFADRYSS